jgi:hypothetical protein
LKVMQVVNNNQH